MLLFIHATRKSPWQQHYRPIDVKLGRTGLAWGRGNHKHAGPSWSNQEGKVTTKRPRACFGLACVFGYASAPSVRMPYIALTENIVAVDDPNSRYYNRLIDKTNQRPRLAQLKDDSKDTTHKWGVFVEQRAAGSRRRIVVFMHCTQFGLEEGAANATSGCTSMMEQNLVEAVRWLDQRSSLLVQLPRKVYNLRVEGNGTYRSCNPMEGAAPSGARPPLHTACWQRATTPAKIITKWRPTYAMLRSSVADRPAARPRLCWPKPGVASSCWSAKNFRVSTSANRSCLSARKRSTGLACAKNSIELFCRNLAVKLSRPVDRRASNFISGRLPFPPGPFLSSDALRVRQIAPRSFARKRRRGMRRNHRQKISRSPMIVCARNRDGRRHQFGRRSRYLLDCSGRQTMLDSSPKYKRRTTISKNFPCSRITKTSPVPTASTAP